jgi:RNA polymerase sigma-70 factor (ECF subfamily)
MPTDPAEEARLIRRVQQGDSGAFDTLVRQHLRRAYTVAYRVVGNREDAEDTVQEGFLAALRHIGSFEVGRPFLPWLCTIIINRGITLRRRWPSRAGEELPDEVIATEPSPLGLVLRKEVVDRVRKTLEILPERQALAIELHDLEGFTADEIGGMLGVAAGTVRWYLHQGRQVLRSALAPLWNRQEDDDGFE